MKATFPQLVQKEKAGILKSVFDFFLILLDYAALTVGSAFVLLSIAEIFMMPSPIPATPLLLLLEDSFASLQIIFRVAFHESALSKLCITDGVSNHSLYLYCQ